MSHLPHLRRTRNHPILRDMLASAHVSRDDLMLPLFVREGKDTVAPIASMPGVHQRSPNMIADELARLADQGLRSCMLFGVIDGDKKDASGSYALRDDSPVALAIRAIRKQGTEMLVAADLCFCEYTDHGHCGIPDLHTTVHNAQTVEQLGKQALMLARAGVDIIAPSGMMDGAVAGIRAALDDAGFEHIPIMGYSVKYASAFYGPFRDAAASAPSRGDRKGYQQDFRRDVREALREAQADIDEGVDIVMVKPGLPYLDVLATLRAAIEAPLAAYHVSGEYAMLKAASERGWIDYEGVLMESLTAFKRAGADIVLTYAAQDALAIMEKR